MFAVPGIAALIVFILARPQEFVPLLQRVPFLHLFTALAVLGWVIDVRLRRLQPVATPGFPWAVAFLGWCLITVAAVVPELLIRKIIELGILFALYGTIAHGVQRFRTFQHLAAVLACTCMFISLVCFHQGIAPKQCIASEERTESGGTPDGRICDTNESCHLNIPEAGVGLEYRCEHVGLFGTYSLEERVRYRGELQDPNEVSLTISAGALSLLVAFLRRKRHPLIRSACVTGIAIVLATVWFSQSRGGQVGALLVFFIYMLRRYGIWAMIPAGVLALPVMLLGGRSGEAADASTQLRYEAWATGLNMFKASPIFGVGHGQFVEHHFLTAHNSFVLTVAELGMPGFFLFTCMIYLTFKSLIGGLIQLRDVPGSESAEVWGMALLAAFAGIMFQINTLSFAYHSVLWIFFGLVGAWTGAIRHHKPDFQMKLTWRDLAIIATVCFVYVFAVLPLFLKSKGEM
ncbi:MAG TPA: O-antigen ligase family protein [Kofleriaceae bacterium]|nr:O-antigen ligase family protein [Kofleriaceae bacterium]